MQKEVHFLNIRVNYSTLVSVSGAPERPPEKAAGVCSIFDDMRKRSCRTNDGISG